MHLARWRGHALARFGHPDAITVLTDALNRLDPSFVRAETALRVDLATALAAGDKQDEARTHADQAARLVEVGDLLARNPRMSVKSGMTLLQSSNLSQNQLGISKSVCRALIRGPRLHLLPHDNQGKQHQLDHGLANPRENRGRRKNRRRETSENSEHVTAPHGADDLGHFDRDRGVEPGNRMGAVEMVPHLHRLPRLPRNSGFSPPDAR